MGLSKGQSVAVKSELTNLMRKHNGVLRPEDVVAHASDARTALHSKFVWPRAKTRHATKKGE